jgi:hypothetical protein
MRLNKFNLGWSGKPDDNRAWRQGMTERHHTFQQQDLTPIIFEIDRYVDRAPEPGEQIAVVLSGDRVVIASIPMIRAKRHTLVKVTGIDERNVSVEAPDGVFHVLERANAALWVYVDESEVDLYAMYTLAGKAGGHLRMIGSFTAAFQWSQEQNRVAKTKVVRHRRQPASRAERQERLRELKAA